LQREFPGPVLGRDKNNPLFAAGTAFLIRDGVWHTWYNSGIRWEYTARGLKHYYGIHHATSRDGIDWVCEKGMCIPFADEYEYAFGRPCVVYDDGQYYMWFAHRATKEIEQYRMGFASSSDGIHWKRDDSLAGIDVSPEGWDTEMICYPYVFDHKGQRYMLYNGNGYGRTGFGFAVLEKE
jgi:sucrose-6-phosphate hydrolase SacC (GH32 family)